MSKEIISPADLRKEVHELRDWFKETGAVGQRKWMRLGKVLARIRDDGCWKEWKAPGGKAYSLFDEYMENEVQISKSKGYALLSVIDNVKLPMATLENLGKSACYELSRVGKEKPKTLLRIVERIQKESEKGPVSLARVRTMCSVALDGAHPNGRYVSIEFLVNEDRAKVVYRALKVLQAEEPVDSPETASARGVHLLSICEEFLTDEHHQKTAKQLEKAGAFKPNSPFKLEE